MVGITIKGRNSTGKYQDWLNIKNRGGNGESSIDWKAGVKEWHIVEYEEDFGNQIYDLKDLSINENEEEILSLEASAEITKFAEIENWKKYSLIRSSTYTTEASIS